MPSFKVLLFEMLLIDTYECFRCKMCDYACKSSATLCAHKKFVHNEGKKLTEFPLPEPDPFK